MGIKKRNPIKKKGGVAIKEASPSTSIMDKRPKFSLKYLNGRYCLSKCETNEKAAFVDTLHHLSKMTWGQIYKTARHGSGYEKIPFDQLSGVPQSFSHKKIIAFRFMDMKPMLGFADEEVFYVLALDRDFTCYRH